MRVDLGHGVGGDRFAVLRPLTGDDELALDASRPDAACALLDRLIEPVAGAAVRPGSLDALSVAEKDRLLAAVFRASFEDRVHGAATCAGCGEPFEFEFALSDLEGRRASDAAPVAVDLRIRLRRRTRSRQAAADGAYRDPARRSGHSHQRQPAR